MTEPAYTVVGADFHTTTCDQATARWVAFNGYIYITKFWRDSVEVAIEGRLVLHDACERWPDLHEPLWVQILRTYDSAPSTYAMPMSKHGNGHNRLSGRTT